MRRKCAGRVQIPGGSRPCKLPPQAGSDFCHQHSGAARPLPPAPPVRRSKPQPPTVAEPGARSQTASSASSSANQAATGCVRDIVSLVTSGEVWDGILDALADKFGTSQNIEQMVHKDLYVTEAIRHAIVPSAACPEALVVFKGGTSLAKAYPILHRFSEDVDVNIVPPLDQRFGDSRRKKARRELHARLEAGIPLPMEHERHGTNFATTTIHYPPVPSGTASGSPGGPAFGEVLVEMNIRGQPPGTYSGQTVASLAGEAAARLDPALLREHPILRPFEVLTADPIIAVVDKLDALHWRSSSDDPGQVRGRARDLYDLACLLRHETVRPRLSSQLVAEMHEIVVDSIPSGLTARATQRPADGFATSPAFQPGHPARRALQGAYPRLRHLVYSDENWIEFDDAVAVVHNNSDLI